jgi:hypothetical protein
MASVGHFAGNFLQAFTQAKKAKEESEDKKKERDARMKLFELQLKREQQQLQQVEQQQGAQSELMNKLSGSTPLQSSPNTRLLDPRPTPSLTELLADPENAALMLRSGFLKGDDLLQQESANANRQMMEKVMGGGGPAGMELQGVKIGPNGQIMPDFGLPQVSVQTIDTPNGPRIVGVNPRTGAQVSDIGPPKEEKRTPEEAGRISGLLQAQEIGTQLTTKFVDPESGAVNRKLVMTAFGRVPGTEGRKVRNDMAIAVDAVLRARTGAGVNATEMKEVVEQFMPSPLDSDDGIKSKMMRFNQFVNGALDVATLPPRIRKLMQEKGMIDESGAMGGANRSTSGWSIEPAQ